MLSFRKKQPQSSRGMGAPMSNRTKPFATSSRVRIGDDAELLYPGLLETRNLAQYAARDQVLVEQAIHEMLSEPLDIPAEPPPPLDVSKAPKPRTTEEKPPPVPPKQSSIETPADKLRQEIETFLEQPMAKVPAPSESHIAFQKKQRPQRPRMPRKKSSQGRVHQSGRVQPTTQGSHRPSRGAGKSASSRNGEALPDVMRKFRDSALASQRTTRAMSRNMNPEASGYSGVEGHVGPPHHAVEPEPFEWDEVPIVLDPGIGQVQ